MSEPQRINDQDIPWREIRGLALRVVDYAPLAERRSGNDLIGRAHVKAFSERLPYAVLEVECIDPAPSNWRTPTALFPVNHRDDFHAVDHAMSLVTDDTEVIIGHRPIRFPWYVPFKRSMPTMVVHLGPKDDGQRAGETPFEYMHRIAPVWVYEPLVSRFGGRWLYVE